MNVADFEARAFAAETARAQRAQAPLVGQFGKRIGLVHELAELAASEEILDDGGKRFRIDQFLRRQSAGGGSKSVMRSLDQALGAGQADAALVLEQFAHRAQAAAAEMIDIVNRALALADVDQIANGLDRLDAVIVFSCSMTAAASRPRPRPPVQVSG